MVHTRADNHTARLKLVVEIGTYQMLGKMYEADEKTLLLSPAQTLTQSNALHLIIMRQSRNKSTGFECSTVLIAVSLNFY